MVAPIVTSTVRLGSGAIARKFGFGRAAKVGNDLRKASKSETLAYIDRTLLTMKKRHAGMKARGISTEAMERGEIHSLEAPSPKANTQALKRYANELRKIDNMAGSNARSPERTARAAKRWEYKKAYKDAKHFDISLTRDQIKEYGPKMANSLSRRIDNLRKQGFDHSALDRAERGITEFLEADLDKDNLNSLRAKYANLGAGYNAKYTTRAGLVQHNNTGNRLFGKFYSKLNTEEQSALWNDLQRIQEELFLDSEQAAEYIKQSIEEQVANTGSVLFYRDNFGTLRARIDLNVPGRRDNAKKVVWEEQRKLNNKRMDRMFADLKIPRKAPTKDYLKYF